MRYRVVSECVVDADSEKAAYAEVSNLLDDGMVDGIVMVSAEQMEPTARELDRYYDLNGADSSERTEAQAAIQRWRA